MDKKLFDLCYEILSHFFHFPEVENTLKSIKDGLDLWENYPQNLIDFQRKQSDIIAYIQKSRFDNIIYECQEGQKILPSIIPGVPYKTLFQDDSNELRVQLENGIIALTLKGFHLVIKHYHPELDNNSLSEELFRLDTSTLQKYGLH